MFNFLLGRSQASARIQRKKKNKSTSERASMPAEQVSAGATKRTKGNRLGAFYCVFLHLINEPRPSTAGALPPRAGYITFDLPTSLGVPAVGDADPSPDGPPHRHHHHHHHHQMRGRCLPLVALLLPPAPPPRVSSLREFVQSST